MTPKLSIVIATYNDNVELAETVKSIRATAGDEPEIVVVDDCSSLAVKYLPGVFVVRNSRRLGCGPSRFVGACRATGEYLLIIDSHMRFTAGWYQEALRWLNPMVLHCGSCVALGKEMNPNAGGQYHGATWNFCGPDRANQRLHQVLECVWASEVADETPEIAAIMGACYFISREWFFKLDPLRHLRLWGGDEQELSLKAWLAGGEIRLLKNVRIGHKFREGRVSNNFVMPWHILYNKLFIAHSCLPPELALRLQIHMHKDMSFNIAIKAIRNDWHLVETSQAYNNRLFTRSFDWLIAKFGLAFPAK